MSVSIRVSFPLPPTTNNLYFSIKTKSGTSRRVLTSQARTWKEKAAQVVADAAAAPGWTLGQKQPYRVEISFSATRPFSWDLDGRLKLLLDAIAAGLGVDDRYIIGMIIEKKRADHDLVAACIYPA